MTQQTFLEHTTDIKCPNCGSEYTVIWYSEQNSTEATIKVTNKTLCGSCKESVLFEVNPENTKITEFVNDPTYFPEQLYFYYSPEDRIKIEDFSIVDGDINELYDIIHKYDYRTQDLVKLAYRLGQIDAFGNSIIGIIRMMNDKGLDVPDYEIVQW